MLTSATFRSLQALVQGTIEGTIHPKRLAWFCVYGSGHLARCLELLKTHQDVLGSSKRGQRLEQTREEIEKLLDSPPLMDKSLRAATPDLFKHKTVLMK